MSPADRERIEARLRENAQFCRTVGPLRLRAGQQVEGERLAVFAADFTEAADLLASQAATPEPVKRYDLITNYRCGSSIEEMEPSDDGEWVRYEEIMRAVTGSADANSLLPQRPDGVMSTTEPKCILQLEEARMVSLEDLRADIIRSTARGQGPTFIAAKLDILIAKATFTGVLTEGVVSATAPEWQPIETAPKDGSEGEMIIVFDPTYQKPVVAAAWDHEEEAESGQCWRASDAILDRLSPTHWMPLPDPPPGEA